MYQIIYQVPFPPPPQPGGLVLFRERILAPAGGVGVLNFVGFFVFINFFLFLMTEGRMRDVLGNSVLPVQSEGERVG